VRDGYAPLAVLEGDELAEPITAADELLTTVIGQDIEQRADGTFAIPRRIAPDQVISTVDCEAQRADPALCGGPGPAQPPNRLSVP
jgi:hypothetical protein